MKIAVVGSRQCDGRGAVEYFIGSLAAKAPNTVIVSGGAKGVDSWAAEAARKAGLTVEVYPADWETYGKGAGFIRNSTIVEKSDKVTAFWDQHSKGTADTIKKARAAGKLAGIIVIKTL